MCDATVYLLMRFLRCVDGQKSVHSTIYIDGSKNTHATPTLALIYDNNATKCVQSFHCVRFLLCFRCKQQMSVNVTHWCVEHRVRVNNKYLRILSLFVSIQTRRDAKHTGVHANTNKQMEKLVVAQRIPILMKERDKEKHGKNTSAHKWKKSAM